MQHRFVYKRCGPDGQWARGPQGQPWRNASQCQLEDDELEVQVSRRRARQGRRGSAEVPRPALTRHRDSQKEVARMYSSFQVMYTVGYCLSLAALLLALAILLGLRYAPASPGRGRGGGGGGRPAGSPTAVPAASCTAPETTST